MWCCILRMLRLCMIALGFPPRNNLANMYSVKAIGPALLSWIVGHFINQAGKQNTSEAQVTDLVWWEWNNELAKSLWGGRSLDWNKSFAKPRYFYLKSKKVCFSYDMNTKNLQKKSFAVPSSRVAEVGSLSTRATMAKKNFAKRVFTFFTTNASFLRVITNLQI